MNIKTTLNTLKAHRADKPLPNLPFSEEIVQTLCDHAHAFEKYATERLERQFHDRFEVGEHLNAFSKLTGLSRHQLGTINAALNLRVRDTVKKRDRIEASRRVKEQRLTTLAAACDVISGYGTASEMAEEYGLTLRPIYTLTQRMSKEWHFNLYDLREMSSPRRRALSKEIEKEYTKRIDEQYAKYLEDEDEG